MADGLYLPPHIDQRTGSACQFSNCWCAVGAWQARGASGGTVRVTPEEFRQKAGGGSGRPNPATGCKTGFEVDIIKGLGSLGLDSRRMDIAYSDLRDRVEKPRRALFAIAVDYSEWPQNLDCMHGIAGPDVNHMVGLVPGITNGKVTVMNPLCKDYQEIALPALANAAIRFAREHGRDYLRLVRVVRPIPADTDGLRLELARLKEEVAERDDYIAAVRRQLVDTLQTEVPR